MSTGQVVVVVAQGAMTDNSYVVVQRVPFGETSFPRCVADCFDHDVLTVSATDQEWTDTYGPMQVFQPGTWFSVTVYGEDHYPLYHFKSEMGQYQHDARLKVALNAVQERQQT